MSEYTFEFSYNTLASQDQIGSKSPGGRGGSKQSDGCFRVQHLSRLHCQRSRRHREGDPVWYSWPGNKNTMRPVCGRINLAFYYCSWGHLQNSTECGYLLSRTTLNEENFNADSTSVRTLAQESGLNGESLLTGPNSFGAYLEAQGFDALPSPRQPTPGNVYWFPE